MYKKIIFIFAILQFSILQAEVPNQCDVLATDALDKSKLPGIKHTKLDNIDTKKAIRACMAAVKDHPDEPRYNYQLGRAYHSLGSDDALKKAFKYYMRAAEQSHTRAQSSIGDMYLQGKGVKYDQQQAFNWSMKAAKKGDPLGKVYVNLTSPFSKKSQEDYQYIFKWTLEGAKLGSVDACAKIGNMYYYGQGVNRNHKKAFDWHFKAAKKGNIPSRMMIINGYCDDDSNNNGTDCIDAFKWRLKIAEKGYDWAQFAIGEMYLAGVGTRKNSKKAFNWLLKAAVGQGNYNAQASIGILYFVGEGVKKNYIKAYSWISLALSENMVDNDKNRLLQIFDSLEKVMTPRQIAIAQNYNPIGANAERKSSKDYISIGSGFFVNNAHAITNHHVVEKCSRIEIVGKDYKTDAKLIADDPKNDLAILETKIAKSQFLHFRTGKPIRIGEEIIVLGYPLGKLLGSGIKLTSGIISSLEGLKDDTTNMIITAPVQPGNSGGPLLDRSGNIVGVIYSRLEKTPSGRSVQNVNLTIKSNIVERLMNIKNIDYEVSSSKEKKDIPDIVDNVENAIVQVVCYH